MEDNKEELPIPSDQITAIEKVKQDTEDIDFSNGILMLISQNIGEKLTVGLSEEMWLFQAG